MNPQLWPLPRGPPRQDIRSSRALRQVPASCPTDAARSGRDPAFRRSWAAASRRRPFRRRPVARPALRASHTAPPTRPPFASSDFSDGYSRARSRKGFAAGQW